MKAMAFINSDNTQRNNQLQISISKSLETQQLIIDTTIKYENLIQTYIKFRTDIIDKRVASIAKYKAMEKAIASEDEIDANFRDTYRQLEKMQSQMNASQTGETSEVNSVANNFNAEINDGLSGYKL
jgi:hypothetical protein